MKKLLLVLLLTNLAFAHALKVFTKQDGEFVNLSAYFSASSPCKECEVKVSKNGVVFESTKTDENGDARLKIMQKEFEILVIGGLGHEKIINFKALGASSNTTNQSKQTKTFNNEQNQSQKVMHIKFSEDKNYYFKLVSSVLAIFIAFGLLYFLKRKK
ncbi:hypothetical protein [Campylobacter geochelonis]|uniref:Co/Ni ABC transporter CbiKLMQO, membrane protein CbiL n=1 Tax=Campylobacter geochelonis TaxID=1780362 RepID=A0A128EG73_9BACT|nr:hypothetical protein [Campylobacter geochelonis]QKF71044.1 cobalt/nickel ECF transporter CbiMNQO, S component CbiN [Campylobacter geochelonis]CZE47213.1 Uncharacterised protein [Campylobacter geochelonis]CZE50140.1 Uncharacterised protein [Campylobacter geochelonis]